MKKIIGIAFALLVLSSCKKLEYTVFDHPYVFVKYANDNAMSETSTVLSMSNNLIRDYHFCISSKKLNEPVVVKYEITHGDGLNEGVDFELLSAGDTLVFNPGVYVRPISIKYLRRKVDKTQDNTITIRILGSFPEMEIGVPGEKPRNAFHTIKKNN